MDGNIPFRVIDMMYGVMWCFQLAHTLAEIRPC